MNRIIGLAVALFFLPALCAAGEPFQGRHCLSFGKDRSLQEARLLVRSLAVRQAIHGTGVLDELSDPPSSQRIDDLVQILASGYVTDVRVLDHSETGDSVCETVEIRANPKAMRNALRREVRRRSEGIEERGLGNNGCLKLLAVQEDEDRYGRRVEAVARVLKATGALQSPEQRRRKPCFKICIDFFGPGEVPLGGEARFIDDSPEGTISGEIRSLSFYVPREAQSYRVWLPNEVLHAASRPKAPAVPAPSAPSAPTGTDTEPGEPARPIEDVKAVEAPEGLRVEVVSDGPVKRHRMFYMDHPPRLVIDLPGRWKRPRFHARRINGPQVERIRIGHHPGKLRLVLDLREGGTATSAIIRETPQGLCVDLKRR